MSNQNAIIGLYSVMIKAGTMTNRGAKIAQVSNYDELQQEKYEASLEFEGDQEGLAARIAEIDAKQVDGGNLEIAVDELVVENIKDKDKSYTYGGGVSASSGGTNLSFSDGGYDKRQTTYATIGSGSITVGGDDYKGDLNRDINSSQVITRDDELGGFDVSVNVDHRLFSKEGRQEWKKEKKAEIANFKNLGSNVLSAGENIVDATGKLKDAVVESWNDQGDGFWENRAKKIATSQAVIDLDIKKANELKIIKNKEKNSKKVLEGALASVGQSFVEASGIDGEVVVEIIDSDQMTAKQRASENGVDKAETKAFYDPESGKIFINSAAMTGSNEDLIGSLGNELSHFVDAQRGVVFDGLEGKRQDISDISTKDFVNSWVNKFGESQDKTKEIAKWRDAQDFTGSNKNAGMVKEAQPRTYIVNGINNNNGDKAPNYLYEFAEEVNTSLDREEVVVAPGVYNKSSENSTNKVLEDLVDVGKEMLNMDVYSRSTAEFILNDLKNNPLEEGEKLNIVGYSGGGQIVYNVAENWDIDKGIDKLITIGSPYIAQQTAESTVNMFVDFASKNDILEKLKIIDKLNRTIKDNNRSEYKFINYDNITHSGEGSYFESDRFLKDFLKEVE